MRLNILYVRDPECFTVKPKESMCRIIVRQLSTMVIEKINMTYLPINSSIFITGNKLQGRFYFHNWQ